jgi:hypothetical protein
VSLAPLRFGFAWILVTAACGSRSPIDAQAEPTALPHDAGEPRAPLPCLPGETQACTGASGCTGTALCRPDGGAFGSCTCAVTCDGGVDSIYLLSRDRALYRFDANTHTAVRLASIGCDLEPESMAVDRRGIAWIEDWINGRLYNVSLSDGSCSVTPFVFPPDFFHFGMSFVADYPGALTEHLYVASDAGLGIIDTTTFTLSLVDLWRGTPSGIAELAGTADARLFSLFGFNVPPSLAELDKTTARVIASSTISSTPFGSFAMAFWGGDLWFFNDTSANRYSIATGAVMLANSNIGFPVVGAGSSTCAPSR